jgi:hypothetical protein
MSFDGSTPLSRQLIALLAQRMRRCVVVDKYVGLSLACIIVCTLLIVQHLIRVNSGSHTVVTHASPEPIIHLWFRSLPIS